MNKTEEVDDFLEHFGVKGQKWGVRREIRKRSFAEQKVITKKNALGEKEARKDPTFKREVSATRKNQGITVNKSRLEKTKGGELLTGRIKGEFTNSKGEKVSEDFANSVLNRAANQNKRRSLENAGRIATAGMLLTFGTLTLAAAKM